MNKFHIAICYLLIAISPALGQRIEIWNNPQAEAEYLAVKTTGELRPSATFAGEIEADLAAIRTAFPVVADLRPYPYWSPGQIWLQFTPAAFDEYQNGSYTGFDSLFTELGTPQIDRSFLNSNDRYLALAFGQVYHSERLADLFRAADGVQIADAEGSIGGGGDITVNPDRTYTIIHSYGDCPAGCLYSESWKFAVTDDSVTILSQPSDTGVFELGPVVDTFPSTPEPSVVSLFAIAWATWLIGRRRLAGARL